MRRILTLTALLLAIALAASACGDDTTTTAASGDDEPTGDLPVNDEQPVNDDLNDDLPLGAGPYPIADLAIHVDDGAGTVRDYRLACLGDTATFTGDTTLDAGAACLALQELPVLSHLIEGHLIQRMCTEIYGGPQTATIVGTLDGTPIDVPVDRVNGCGIADWDLLVALLGPV